MLRRLNAAAVVVASAWLALGAACARRPAEPQRRDVRPAADGGGATLPAIAVEGLIPARVRRLSNAEYNQSVAALLESKLAPGRNFAPDKRQAGFSVNEAQRVDSVLAKQLFAAAEKLAAEARGRLNELAPCATPAEPEACASAFIRGFGARAYRRPVRPEEVDSLLAVFRAGALDASYHDGIELVIRALVQSAGFLYLTELGEPGAANKDAVALTQQELASELAYLMTGAPPDQALRDAAAAGQLASAEVRRSQLQRLRREYPASREQLVRTLREWLQLDRAEFAAKDVAVYPQFELVRQSFITESQAFIAAVLDRPSKDTSDLSTLLGADWTVGNKTLAKFYDAEPPAEDGGRIQLPARRGILNQGAFLAAQAHARESAPVLRGALIARRLACIPVPAPDTLGIIVLPPPPDPKLTTRERFDLHATNPKCAECHESIDSFGNTFEHYDGMGALRELENEAKIDTATEVAVKADFDGPYPDSNALATALAASPMVRECFARYMFRAATARSVDSDTAAGTVRSENAFVEAWRALPEAKRGNVMDTLEAYVSSRLFTHRRAL